MDDNEVFLRRATVQINTLVMRQGLNRHILDHGVAIRLQKDSAKALYMNVSSAR